MSSILGLNHCVVICTLNRQESLERLLKSMSVTVGAEEIRVLIIDSSTDLEYKSRIAAQLKNNFAPTSNLVTDPRGLPSCRNVAIMMINEDLTHFFDDDITIEISYFENCDKFFLDNPTISGGGPRVKNLYLDSNASFLQRVVGQDPLKAQGKITRTGRNNWVKDDPLCDPIDVDWIPGCSMIFRKEVIAKFRFNENLEKGPGRNYALGEDVDYGWRVSQEFSLSSIPLEVITHHLAPSKRDNEKLMKEASGVWLAYLTRLARGRVSPSAVLFTFLIEFLADIVLVSLLQFVGFSKEFLRVLISPNRIWHKRLIGVVVNFIKSRSSANRRIFIGLSTKFRSFIRERFRQTISLSSGE